MRDFFTEEGEATWRDGLQNLLTVRARGVGACCFLLLVRCCLGQRGAGKGMSLDGNFLCHDWGKGESFLSLLDWLRRLRNDVSCCWNSAWGNCWVHKSVIKST